MNLDRRLLPFTVSLAQTAQDIADIITHRAKGYGRRSPMLGKALSMPEAWDAPEPGRQLIMARSKMDGALLGSVRVFTHDGPLLSIDKTLVLPESMSGARVMTAARFSVTAGPVCRAALFKAALEYGRAQRAEHFVIATLPSIAPIYEHFGFLDLFDDGRMIPIASAENLQHRLMAVGINQTACEIRPRRPAVAEFLDASHPDIDISRAILMPRAT